MARDAKWYASWIRLLPASSADEKMINLAAADLMEELDKQVSRWISVEERLPETIDDVAVIIADGCCYYYRIGWRRANGEWVQAGLGPIVGEVTHWMPLPKPPKED